MFDAHSTRKRVLLALAMLVCLVIVGEALAQDKVPAADGKKDLAVKALESFLEYYPEDSGDLVIEAKSLLEQNR